MAQVPYQEVVQLAEQLTLDEKKALIAHLQRQTPPQMMSYSEWRALIDSVTVSIEPGPQFSDRREDWYDDDSR